MEKWAQKIYRKPKSIFNSSYLLQLFLVLKHRWQSHLPCPQLAKVALKPVLYIWPRTHGRNMPWVNIVMALGIILLDVLEMRRLLEALHIPVQVFQIVVQKRIVVSDGSKIAFEMLYV